MSKQQEKKEGSQPLIAQTGMKIECIIYYHYAHVIPYCNIQGTLEIIEPTISRTLVKITNFKENPQHIEVIFSSKIKEILNDKNNNNFNLEVDTYSNLVVLKYSISKWSKPDINNQINKISNDPYIYDEQLGYMEPVQHCIYAGNTSAGFSPQFELKINYKPSDDFGYISQSHSFLIESFINGNAKIENLQKGLLRFYTSSFDTKGYIGQLFSEEILGITQFLDKIKLERPSLKEVTEQKEEDIELSDTCNLIPTTGLEDAPLIGVDSNII